MIEILVGPIASGKSTYCQIAANHGSFILNDDAIVNMLHANDYTRYNPNYKILYKSIENHIVASVLAMDRSVVIDRGLNISIQGRKRFITLAKSFDVLCHATVFKKEDPAIHAERRMKSDSRGHDYEYWLSVARLHDLHYEYPTVEEGFDKIYEMSYEQILEWMPK